MSVIRSWLGADFLFTAPRCGVWAAASHSTNFRIDPAAAMPPQEMSGGLD
jgi:hypothetical protein